jgi:hypothetical protein
MEGCLAMISHLFGFLSADMAIDPGARNALVPVKDRGIVLHGPGIAAIADHRAASRCRRCAVTKLGRGLLPLVSFVGGGIRPGAGPRAPQSAGRGGFWGWTNPQRALRSASRSRTVGRCPAGA